MTDFKIIERKNKKILKYQNQVFKFNTTLNTRGKHTLWTCSTENCKAYVKLDRDGKKVIETNDKHEHNKTVKRNSKSTSSESDPDDHFSDAKNSPINNKTKENNSPSSTRAKEAITPMLPFNSFNQSVLSALSVITPDLNATQKHDNTMNQTPQAQDVVQELKRQVDGLIQEIIKKQQEIDRLMDKSKADDKDMADMLQAIRSLEANNHDEETSEIKKKMKNDENNFKQIIAEKEEIILNKERVITSLKAEINQTKNITSPQKTKKNRTCNEKNKTERKDINKKQNSTTRPGKPTLSLKATSIATEVHKQQEHSENTINEKKINKKTCIILGDSQSRNIGKYMENISVNDQLSVKSYVGPGADMAKVMEGGLGCWQEELAEKKENQLVIFAGTIDCFHNLRWISIKQTIQKIKQISENNHVTIFLIPYSINDRFFNINAFKLNKFIFDNLRNERNVKLIDTNNIVYIPKYYKFDMYHLNNLGKRVLARTICNIITEQTGKVSYSKPHPLPNLY